MGSDGLGANPQRQRNVLIAQILIDEPEDPILLRGHAKGTFDLVHRRSLAFWEVINARN